jgi:DNA invertase Pin-like site-specific DNA recombinase
MGIRAAVARKTRKPKSHKIGRPRSLTPEQEAEVRRLRKEGVSTKNIATATGFPEGAVRWVLTHD